MNVRPYTSHEVDLISRRGVCDRLRAITFLIGLCVSLGDENLFVDLEKSEHCPYDLDDIFEIEGINFKITKEVNPVDYHLFSSNFSPVTRKGVLSLKPENVECHKLFSEWHAAYGRLKPHVSIAHEIEGLKVDDSFLGVHVRRTDKVSNSKFAIAEFTTTPSEILPDLDREFLKRIFSSLKSRALNKVYLACDNQASMELYRNRILEGGVNVVTNGEAFDDSELRHTSGKSLAMDIFSLSNCSGILKSINSGVPDLARRIKKHRTG